MHSRKLYSLFLAGSLLLSACSGKSSGPTDTPSSGTISISVDETYKPVIEQQLHVFDSSNPEAHIKVQYKSEADCIKDYLSGKVRLILVTRPLNAEELKVCEAKYIVPKSKELARDAVAIILNRQNPDTAFSVAQLRGIMSGQYKDKYSVVFDNGGSSTLRFMQDSIMKGTKLGENVYAANGNDSVLRYVMQNPRGMGIVGLSNVSSDDDPDNTGAFINSVRVAAILNERSGDFEQPYQAYVARRSYPLSRNLYFIKNEQHQGLGTGFANFLTRERGQLIFAHAHLFPLQFSVILRPAHLNMGGE